MLETTACPSCSTEHIQRVRRTWTGEYHGRRYAVPALSYYECPDCGEKVYDRDEMRRIEAHSPAFALGAKRRRG